VNTEICSRCVLPVSFPGIEFRDGVCNFCESYSDTTVVALKKQELTLRMEAAIEECRGRGTYECVVAYSGGKDSSYVLMKLVRTYRLRCLAVTIDNGFVSPQAVENCKTVTRHLGVDFSFFTPAFDFMRRLYVTSATDPSLHPPGAMRRASAICNSCIGLINAHMLQTALQHEAPLIAGGYLGGQVPADAALITFDNRLPNLARDAQLGRMTRALGKGAARYFAIQSSGARQNQKVSIINPMLTFSCTEREIIRAISEIGWIATKDTGANSSNCQLNDLGIALHYRKHGFHPYAFELSEQVRIGALTREEALGRVLHVPSLPALDTQLKALNLDPAGNRADDMGR